MSKLTAPKVPNSVMFVGGIMSREWQNFFRDLMLRVGGYDTPALSEVGTHGNLSSLGEDDHPQYHNDDRGDTRYLNINNVLEYLPSGDYNPATVKFVMDLFLGISTPTTPESSGVGFNTAAALGTL